MTPTNPNKALWEKGDFTRIADSMRESGEALVGRLGITEGLRFWISAAAMERRHCRRRDSERTCWASTSRATWSRPGTSVRRSRASRTAGFRRAMRPNLQELKDHSFDLVVSIFGAMFAPKPFDVAKEMVRVTRPGGRIVMGNWIPNDPTLVAQILKISSAYSPPPPEGFISPMTWGVESNVIERFAAAGVPERSDLVRQRHLHLQLPGNAVGVRCRVPEILRADHECVRSGGEERSRRRSAEGTGGPVQQPEQEPEQGCHLHSCDLLARYRCAQLVFEPARHRVGL